MPVAAPAEHHVHAALPALVGALICLLLLAIVGLLALTVPGLQNVDGHALRSLMALDTQTTDESLQVTTQLVDPKPFALATLTLVGSAAWQRRWFVAAVLPVLLVGSGVTTQVLKDMLDVERLSTWLGSPQVAAEWPSGHSTAAMALALGLVLVVPRAWKPAAAVVGGAFAIVLGTAVVASGGHFASDVLGGFLVAATWGLLAIAVLRVVDPAPAAAPAWSWRVAWALGAVGVVLVLAVAVALAVAAPDVARAVARPACVAAVTAIAALGAVLTVGTTRVAEGRV